jgi:hypothetical protein
VRVWLGLLFLKFLCQRFAVANVFRKLLAEITFEEKMLRKLPHTSQVSRIEVRHPPSISNDEARLALEELLNVNKDFHRKWMRISLAAPIPVSLMGMFFPFPNLPLLWILVRLYSHYHALESAKFLTSRLSEQKIEFILDDKIEAMLNEEGSRSIKECEDHLAQLVLKDVPPSDQTLKSD